ncbi:DnaT-like ssDNA-binding protein [Brevundimonas sp.]|uniref:DnaT-like ssDNA-binding protein n=1 Tax=Brevundimonas sp. TaxID=1871086 RepID=UPI003B00538A
MDYYDDDLSPADSLITLQAADIILATSLHGREWTARVAADKQAATDDPERLPERADDKAALIDASTIMAAQPWKGRKASPDQTQAFPRIGVHLDTGQAVIGVPAPIQRATALLAAHLSPPRRYADHRRNDGQLRHWRDERHLPRPLAGRASPPSSPVDHALSERRIGLDDGAPMIALDYFDHQTSVFEAEFLEALAKAYGGAMDAVDINALIAALEAGDEAALAKILDLDEGVHSGLAVAFSSGLFFALLGNAVIAMKTFANRHKSIVNPNAEVNQLREDIERNILQPMTRRSYEAITTAYRELQKSDMTARAKAILIVRSIAMAPDQARSAAHFARALHEALTAKDRSVQDGKTYATPATAKTDHPAAHEAPQRRPTVGTTKRFRKRPDRRRNDNPSTAT